jgi:hypothetical protein
MTIACAGCGQSEPYDCDSLAAIHERAYDALIDYHIDATDQASAGGVELTEAEAEQQELLASLRGAALAASRACTVR